MERTQHVAVKKMAAGASARIVSDMRTTDVAKRATELTELTELYRWLCREYEIDISEAELMEPARRMELRREASHKWGSSPLPSSFKEQKK